MRFRHVSGNRGCALMGAYWLQVPGTYQRSNETEAGPQLAAVQRNTRELSRDEEAYFSEATGCLLYTSDAADE